MKIGYIYELITQIGLESTLFEIDDKDNTVLSIIKNVKPDRRGFIFCDDLSSENLHYLYTLKKTYINNVNINSISYDNYLDWYEKQKDKYEYVIHHESHFY